MVFSVLRRLGYVYGVPSLDNFIFKLCYRWTVLILIAFSFVITCKLRFGYSFYCAASSVSDTYATMKCYGSEIFSLPVGIQNREKEEKKQHYLHYYSWVNLLFLVHAFNFYLPHLLWRSFERGYVYRLTAGIHKSIDKEEKRDLELNRLAKYVFDSHGKHKLYTLLYISCEILNFVVSLSHVLWLKSFFNITPVPDSIPYVFNTASDFKNYYFPREGGCIFQKTSASGVMQRNEALCELQLNDLYMYMYMFLQAWYSAITLLISLLIIYRSCLLIPSTRMFFSKVSSPMSVVSILSSVCHHMSYSDWFFLSRLQYALTDVDFAHLIDKIAIVSQGKDPQSDEYKRFTVIDDTTKDLDNSSNITSPV